MKVVDARIQGVVYPHGPAGCSKDGAGFLKNLNRARRMSQKLLAFLVILPPVLRDYVPELRLGIRKLVFGLKILEGRCLNAQESMHFNVEPGSRPLFQEELQKAKTLIIEGLSILEGMTTCTRTICTHTHMHTHHAPISSHHIPIPTPTP